MVTWCELYWINLNSVVILVILGVPKLEQTTAGMKHVTINQADGMIRGKGLGKSPRFFVITVRYITLLALCKIATVPFSRCPASVWRDSVWCRDNCCLYLSHVKTPEEESGLYWDCIYACARQLGPDAGYHSKTSVSAKLTPSETMLQARPKRLRSIASIFILLCMAPTPQARNGAALAVCHGKSCA